MSLLHAVEGEWRTQLRKIPRNRYMKETERPRWKAGGRQRHPLSDWNASCAIVCHGSSYTESQNHRMV